MGREIEFRAWLKDKKRMVKVSFINLISKKVIDPFFNSYNFNEIELMQYTGLKDKNGVKIFEGDIVKHSDIVCEVAWSEYSRSFILVSIKDGIESFSLIDNGVNINEVIGNIFENPKLLEVENER